MTWNNWGLNEPNGGDRDHCLQINTAGKWNDALCDACMGYICEL